MGDVGETKWKGPTEPYGTGIAPPAQPWTGSIPRGTGPQILVTQGPDWKNRGIWGVQVLSPPVPPRTISPQSPKAKHMGWVQIPKSWFPFWNPGPIPIRILSGFNIEPHLDKSEKSDWPQVVEYKPGGPTPPVHHARASTPGFF